MIKLYSAEICPFAQRSRAVLVRLGQPFETVTIDLSDRDRGFLKLTPTGKVPLLVEGDLKLYESQAINDYLAERNQWKEAYSRDLAVRSRQKLAMKQWDEVVVPAWYRGLHDPSSFKGKARERVAGEIGELAATVSLLRGEVDSLPALHFAPFWARMGWLRESSPVCAMVEEHRELEGWLDRAVALPAIQETLCDRESAVGRYGRPPRGSVS